MQVIPSASDSQILADSQFDLDANSSGWLFFVRDGEGNYEEMKAIRPSPDEILSDIVLVCSDQYAVLQRDSLHPGHNGSPCLVFDAVRDLNACLFVQASIILPQCEDSIAVMVSINHQEVVRTKASYCEIATLTGPLSLKQGDRLVVQFSKVQDIRNLHVLHYATLWETSNVQAGNGEPNGGRISVTVNSTLSGIDYGLMERMAQADIPPQTISRLARNPFATITGEELSAAIAASVARARRRTNTAALGEARHFDARRATKDGAP